MYAYRVSSACMSILDRPDYFTVILQSSSFRGRLAGRFIIFFVLSHATVQGKKCTKEQVCFPAAAVLNHVSHEVSTYLK